jgi:hypothetical protein
MKVLFIPDCQVKEGVPLDHLEWIGKYIVDKKPDVIINAGDFADMPSLSTHDKVGSKYFEGMRYRKDIDSAKAAMKLLLEPLREMQKNQRKNKIKVYNPRMVMLLGNHCDRINRAINNNPMLEGVISVKDLDYEKDWEVHEFLEPVIINGVAFSHYFPVGALGRPASSASAMVTKLHMSAVAGHQQGRSVAYGRKADGTTITCIIAGSCYLHDEHYMPSVSNRYWRGLVVLNEVKDGAFDEMFLSLDYLRNKYA